MTYPVARRRLTVEQFQQMIAHGILAKDDRVELLNGEIVEMSPINPSHAGAVKRLNQLFSHLISEEVLIAIQDPIQLDDNSQPQPDFCLLRAKADFYQSSHPRPADILLIIEVAETSARLDRSLKRPMYAQAGIAELWIIDLTAKVIEVCLQPSDGQYQMIHQVRAGQTLAPQALPEAFVRVEALLG